MATSLTAATSDRFQEYSVGMHSAQIIASELGATTDMNNKFISTIVVHSKNDVHVITVNHRGNTGTVHDDGCLQASVVTMSTLGE